MLFPLGKALFWAISFNFLFSFCFMLTTQVNHLSEELLSNGENPNKCWSIHQVLTAQSFDHDSYFWWIFGGGLNYQIEHHLFPGINHEHLPRLKPIVTRLCSKYNVPYYYSPSYFDLFWKYIEVVKKGAEKRSHHQ
jgi:fatty acid desaturase